MAASLSNRCEPFLMDSPDSISSPETDLEMFCSTSTTPHSFSSTLLDDFQLDLELECEDDNFMTLDNECHSLKSNVSIISATPTPYLNLPIANLGSEAIPKINSQGVKNPVIAGLIQSGFNFNEHQKVVPFSEPVLHDEVPFQKLSSSSFTQRLHNLNFQNNSTILSPSVRGVGKKLMTSSSLAAPDKVVQNFILCPMCKVPFSSLKTLLSHFTDQHSKVKDEPISDGHPCTGVRKRNGPKNKPGAKRGKTHTAVGKLKQNEKSRPKNDEPFHCHMCSYVGKKKVFVEHLKTQHNPNRKKFVCTLCTYSCHQERSFKVHQLTHEGADGKFACDQCGKLFFTMGILKRHARTHNTSRPYVCHFEFCRKAFTIMSRLTDHLRTVHDHKNPKLSSQKRIRMLEDDVDCQRKMIASQDDINDMECEELASRPNAASLDRDSPVLSLSSDAQMSQIHRNSSIGPTEVAHDVYNEDLIIVYDIVLQHNHNYPNSSHDNSNSQTITKSNPSDSSEFLPQHDSLVNSKSAIDTAMLRQNCKSKKNTNFQCSWTGCGKYFRDVYNLRKHMNAHTGEMEISCPLCRYRCIQKSALDKHLKTHKKT